MKNAITLAALIIFAMMFTSCRKEYTCSCTYTDPATGATPAPIIYNMGKRNKKEAEKNCGIDRITFSSQFTTSAGKGSSPGTGWNCHI